VVRVPRAISPRALRAGPSPGKPIADLALAGALARAQRARRFDAALAHNGEAALAALAVRKLVQVPVIYVAHTLLGCELDAYLPAALGAMARRAGDALDRGLAARCDGVIALCREAATRLGRHARAPLTVIPPGLDPRPPPDAEEILRTCTHAGVTPGRFGLYTGNLDRYQDLDVLVEAASLVPGLPLLVATHGTRRLDAPGLRCLATTPREARALSFACTAAVLPRRRPGGFPVKLLNYMEAARPIVAREGIADGLVHDRSAWLLPRDAGAEHFAAALRGLLGDPGHAERLGRGGRAVLEERHAWPQLARRTVAFVEQIRRSPEPNQPVETRSPS
jgi:glycosyltransferase involved in cell wall biosynthesis